MPDTDIAAESEPIGGRSVRGHLALFALALVGPLLAFLAFLLWQIASTERDRLEGEATTLARTVATALDRELATVFGTIDVLAQAQSLQDGDIAAFHRQGVELRGRGLLFVLLDRDGRQLANPAVPLGSPLPQSTVGWGEESLARGRPFVTNMIVGRVTGDRVFSVVSPVRVNGEPRYFLSLRLDLSRLQQIIASADVPPGYTAFIVDRAGIVMARSTGLDEVVGRSAGADFIARTSGARTGSWSGVAATTGRNVFIAYDKSSLSDYTVGASVAQSELNAPLWRSLSLFALAGAAAVALTAPLALLFGRRITAPIGALARQAAALGRGETVETPATKLLEANQVGAELARASANLRERETELREANDEIQRFAYIVSHDLRSPLVNIMGFTTELEALRADLFERLAALRKAAGDAAAARDDELGQDFDEAIGFIKASIGKMDRLIGAILQLSREGRREFSPERVDMDALLAGIKASLTHQAEQAQATVTVDKLPPVLSDRLALEQIFSNLVDNALKYLRKGVPGRVEVRGRTERRHVIYEVEDNGRGIDARDRERVFDLFRRSGVQDRPGEGIGLAHVRALVRRLGGSINLTSEPGRGSTFTVTLPRRWAGERQRKAA